MARALGSLRLQLPRRYASGLYPLPLSYPVVEKCPAPTRACATQPPGLDIDHERPIFGTAPNYYQHLVISTGKQDWMSSIEDEPQPNLATAAKSLFRPKGLYHDPYRPVMITNSSFPTSFSSAPRTASAFVFPKFVYIPQISLEDGSQQEVMARLIHDKPSKDEIGPSDDTALAVREITEAVVLICGHGSRDCRCGIMGPVLQEEFVQALTHAGVPVSNDAPEHRAGEPGIQARVGQTSHVGGHKFAGNVIIYIPPTWQKTGGLASPLAGMGIWYGRVEPRHVQGIVEETVLRGKVIGELLRGVH